MRSAMQYYDMMDARLLLTKSKIEAILESVDDKPDTEEPLWSCHAVCRALCSMHHALGIFEGWDVLVQDGYFHRVGCEHAWLLLTNKMTLRRVICDPLPMGGHGVVFSAQDNSLVPWYGLYVEDAAKYEARLTKFQIEAVDLEFAIQEMIDRGMRQLGASSVYA
ncbi:hypothetical protein [Rhizobium phage RHEph12]|nr:hypothetical protein [Rhizobium phage RHEph12]